jgi:hypothetical protein
MLKKIIYLTVALGLLIGAGVLVSIAPYHIYTLTLTEGVNTRFLKMDSTKEVFYDGDENHFNEKRDMKDENFYQTFHFGHFEIPMPINHPLFSLIPIIKIEGSGPRLGASFQNGKNIELFSFMIEKSYKFETSSGDQKLFLLPVFKNYISRKTNEEVWADLFRKKLSLPSNEGESFYESLKVLKKVSYYDLVYNLYILFNRLYVIPTEAEKFVLYPEKKMGIVTLPSLDKKMLTERLYIIENGFVYPVLIKTRLGNPNANNFRQKFIQEITYKSTNADSAISIYARYKQISYGQRVDQQGMTYLYSAWSHDLDNREFVRFIILFLERGKLNLKYLNPFYEFAYRKFGSTLSSASGYLNENAQEAIKRKAALELEEEIGKGGGQDRPSYEGQFENPEEKIKYMLQKAKDNKKNSDDSEKVLSIE